MSEKELIEESGTIMPSEVTDDVVSVPKCHGWTDEDLEQHDRYVATRAILENKEAFLGLATNQELIEELSARAVMAKSFGETWPDYRTVDGSITIQVNNAEAEVDLDNQDAPEQVTESSVNPESEYPTTGNVVRVEPGDLPPMRFVGSGE